MTEIVPITEQDPEDVGRQVHALVKAEKVQALLEKRHFVGVLARNSKSETAAAEHAWATQKQHQAGKMVVLVVMNNEGNVAGLGTALPDLPLDMLLGSRWMINRLPPGLRPHWLSKQLLNAHELGLERFNPNIAAWTSETDGEAPALQAAYQRLVSTSGLPSTASYRRLRPTGVLSIDNYITAHLPMPKPMPWAVEPLRSPAFIHDAIREAGLDVCMNGYFDDQEDRHHPVPEARLYTAPPLPAEPSRQVAL